MTPTTHKEETMDTTVYTNANLDEFIAAKHSGNTLEVDRDIFDYFLEVLPPIFMDKTIDGRRYSFGFAEGAESVVGFWHEGTGDDERYFCRDLHMMNPHA